MLQDSGPQGSQGFSILGFGLVSSEVQGYQGIQGCRVAPGFESGMNLYRV